MVDKDVMLARLMEENRQLRENVVFLNNQIDTLREEIARLKKNSRNSSKPPSSDIVKPPKPPGKENKPKQGAQPGHPKHERPLFEKDQIDEFHDYVLPSCLDCAGAIVLRLDLAPRVIQQVAIREAPLVRHERCAYAVWCPSCDRIHYSPFPPEVVKAGLFQERITAWVAYMKYVCDASFSTIRKFVCDILGETICRGYLRKVLAKVTSSLDGPYEQLLNQLPLETVVDDLTRILSNRLCQLTSPSNRL